MRNAFAVSLMRVCRHSIALTVLVGTIVVMAVAAFAQQEAGLQAKGPVLQRKGYDITKTGLTPRYPSGMSCSPLTSFYASWDDVDGTRRDEAHSGVDGGRLGDAIIAPAIKVSCGIPAAMMPGSAITKKRRVLGDRTRRGRSGGAGRRSRAAPVTASCASPARTTAAERMTPALRETCRNAIKATAATATPL